MAFLTQFANIGSIFLSPLLLIEEGGDSALAAGLVLAPGAAAVAALSPLAGRLSDRLGPRAVILSGIAVMLAATLFLSTYATARPAYLLALGLFALGVGFAGVNSPAANAASATLARESAGVGLGVYQLFFFLGSGSGPAILGAFLSSRREGGEGPLNPFYGFDASPYSDAFLLAAAALALALLAAVGVEGSEGNRESAKPGRFAGSEGSGQSLSKERQGRQGG
ncbi:MAG: MFS transporter [Actinomycetota bacterium]|nr:MFS transporter [Actinomycetota bacterium]MDP9484226.1 MFS transporter [Actinomycetota bacterium]